MDRRESRLSNGIRPYGLIGAFDVSSVVAMDLKEVMAINLRRIRHKKEMTQEELADGAGLSVRYVGAIEAPMCRPA
ncbi:DNA-binding transcriptional regulator YiaG [Bradyrhizobium elkanii]|nr:DNA-binding transcriptional regulator YiaG [Bradyrhizobium elkanii]MCS3966691.1 DNA-binding transcriptional regulator YiaG [Bradyrhizobium japonicum]